jgi:tripartite-type tricarboxylate transporter receptor subunit TctC
MAAHGMEERHEGKSMSRREFLRLAAAGAASTLLLPGTARAAPAGWPERTIFTVVGYAAGGGTDIVMRGIAKPMERLLGRPINVTNRPGSVAALATDFIWKRPADGYWWLGTSNYNKFLRVQGLHATVPWKDWQFYKISTSVAGWAVKPDSPYKTFGDLIEAAKRAPERIRVANSGIGGVWHEATLLVEKFAGVKFRPVPYEGGAPAVLAGLRGEVDVIASGVHEQIEQLRAGNLRNLGVFAAEPLRVSGVDALPPVTTVVPPLRNFAPFGGPLTLGIRRDVDVEILKTIEQYLRRAVDDAEYAQMLGHQVLFKSLKTGRDADREAAAMESVTAWLFWEQKLETAKANPTTLGIPRPEEFEKWWPPRDYKPAW